MPFVSCHPGSLRLRPVLPWSCPAWCGFFARVKTRAPSFEILLQRAANRQQLAPLLRALGFVPTLAPLASEEREAFGLDGEIGVRDVFAAERDGVRTLVIELAGSPAPDTTRLARRVRVRDAARTHLFLFAEARYRRLTFASFGLEGELRRLVIDRQRPRPADIEALEELAARDGEGGVALALRHARALDRSVVTRRFFRDFKAQRARVAEAWSGVPADARTEREQLALLLLSRLLFLYFLQRRGQLCGDYTYLPRRMREWLREGRRADGQAGGGRRITFHHAVLHPLFFGALNTRPEDRDVAALALGPLPYLNGGLFERHALERRFPDAALDDETMAAIFDDLLERYRFTTREATDAAVEGAGEVGVDPEMLGRVFEGLMTPDRRGASGTFYTPAPVVDRLVCEALEAWLTGTAGIDSDAARRLVRDGVTDGLDPVQRAELRDRVTGARALDPACGSGAFLLGALSRLARLRTVLAGESAEQARREIVGHSIHGVDVQDDAALLCALRLWLALSLDEVDHTPTPLPNLDRRIRQGDALIDPLDLVGADAFGLAVTGEASVARLVRRIRPLADRYLSAEPREKPSLQRSLKAAELALARAWTLALERRLDARIAELRTLSESRDLFGERAHSAQRAEMMLRDLGPRHEELKRLRSALDDGGTLPFFSFGVHFSEAAQPGFDLILSNPPWVRAHRWPAALGAQIRKRYAVCRDPGWRRGTRLSGSPGGAGAQVDLSLLFLERSLRLLAEDGALAMLLPAKSIRSLYGGSARRMLLRETRLVSLEDHSLDQRSIFRADAFAASVVVRKAPDTGVPENSGAIGPVVRVTMVRRGVQPLRYALSQRDLGVIAGDDAAPWLLAPPAARSALRQMQRAGPVVGEHPSLRVRRGIVTGANDVLIIRDVEPKMAGLSWIHAEGYDRARRAGKAAAHADRFRALIETDALRPLVRGRGLRAWSYEAPDHVIWIHDDKTAEPAPPPPRTRRYLEHHADTLRRVGGRAPARRSRRPVGALMRLSPEILGPKVAWQDLSATLNAVALPARARGTDGRSVPLIPLNTVYYLPTSGEDQALLLAALFNSLPVRTFARAVAERAKDARFRFLAWTTSLIPLPRGWASGPARRALLEISRYAHERKGITEAAQRELDALAAELYSLSHDDMEALTAFDRWLRGEP